MTARYTLPEANALLPLMASISRELADRRVQRRRLLRCKAELEAANTPEGVDNAIREIAAQLHEHEFATAAAINELGRLGITILRQFPLTLHVPGRSRRGPLVFCWQEGESRIGHGHAVGEEEDPRRPLRVRAAEDGDSSAA